MSRRASPQPATSGEELLKAELQYISQTAFQANEDRARVSSFYLVGVGSLVAAVLSAQVVRPGSDATAAAWAFAALFLMLTALGALTTVQLARLRAAWHESMLAMNQLKEHWLSRTGDPDLRQAFRWDASTLPPRYKPRSVSYLQALEVALLSGLTFGAAVFFFQQAIRYLHPACNWAFSVSFGLLACLLELKLYKQNLG